MIATNSNKIYFGGPDLPPGRLRDVLAQRIGEVPASGAIDWVTYYFRDRRLADEMLRAHRRGVKVTVTLERHPRTPDANDEVVAMLAGPEGLGKGFRTISLAALPSVTGKVRKPRLHEKLYCFSHPKPIAFIGSFNPSGDDPEDRPDIIREIGDQDRGHNALVGLVDPKLVERLVNHARRMNQAPQGIFYRFSPNANRALKSVDTEIHFWPRVGLHPIIRFLRRVGVGGHVRIVASHINGKAIVETLIGLAHRGAALAVLTDPTSRRVPAEVEQRLTSVGIPFRRVRHPEGLPMHHKFVLVEQNNQRWVVFGSFNWTTRSYWLNHEIGAISTNRQLFDAFAERWGAMSLQAG